MSGKWVTRYDHGDALPDRLLGARFLVEPISFVMERKMLSVIKALAEGTAADDAADARSSTNLPKAS